MISVSDALSIHSLLIKRYGGSPGIRDQAILEAALARPSQTFDNEPLYPGPVDKAAAVFESLIKGHPFIDGNKRVAYALLVVTLADFGHDLSADQDEKYRFVIAAAEGALSYDEIREWISGHIRVL